MYDIRSKLSGLIGFITHETWSDYKNRFLFAKRCVDKSGEQPRDNITKGSTLVHKIFYDDEKDFGKLVKNYTTEKTSWYSNVSGFFKNSTANEIIAKAKKIPDNVFMRQVLDYGDESIVTQFSEIYQVWKKSKFQESLRQFLQDLKQEAEKTLNQINERELLNRKQRMEWQHFNEICDNLEAKYPTGDLFKIINVYGRYNFDKFYNYGKNDINSIFCLNG